MPDTMNDQPASLQKTRVVVAIAIHHDPVIHGILRPTKIRPNSCVSQTATTYLVREYMSDSGPHKDPSIPIEAGDEQSFIEQFSQSRSRLKQMLEFRMDRRLRAREDPSDILQEVYIDAVQRLEHYRKKPELSFYVWLRQLTTQRLIDVHRRHLKAEVRNVKQEVSLDHRRLAATSASMAMQLAAHLASPSQLAMRAEMISIIEEALDNMDEIDREILALRHFEELRNSEVAEVLGLKEAAASNRYVRALSRLQEVLQDIPGFFDEV